MSGIKVSPDAINIVGEMRIRKKVRCWGRGRAR